MKLPLLFFLPALVLLSQGFTPTPSQTGGGVASGFPTSQQAGITGNPNTQACVTGYPNVSYSTGTVPNIVITNYSCGGSGTPGVYGAQSASLPSQATNTITANLTGSSAPPTGQTPAAIAAAISAVTTNNSAAQNVPQLTTTILNNNPNVEGFPATCTSPGTYTTQLDCAHYTALAQSVANGTLPSLKLGGGGIYNTCAGLNMGSLGSSGVSLMGAGPSGSPLSTTTIKAVCSLSNAVIQHLPSTGQLSNLMYYDLTINANGEGQIAELDSITSLLISSLHSNGTSTSMDHAFGLGGSGSSDYNAVIDDLQVSQSGNGPTSWASLTASGATMALTVNMGGTYINSGALAVSVSPYPGASCTTYGTGTAIASAGTVTSASTTGYSGCTGSFYVSVPDIPPVVSGVKAYASDSTIKDAYIQHPGQNCWSSYGSDVVYYHYHGQGCITNFTDYGGAVMSDPYYDSPVFIGHDFESSSIVNNAGFFWNGTYPQAFQYKLNFAQAGYGVIDNSYCSNNGGAGLFISSTGSILNLNANPPVFPGGFIVKNANACDGTYKTVNWNTGGYIVGQQYMVSIQAPTSLTITPNSTGSTTYTYEVTPYAADGISHGPGISQTITNGSANPNNTLTVVGPNNVAFYQVTILAGGTGFVSGLIGRTRSTTYVDTSGIGDGASYSYGQTSGTTMYGNGAFMCGTNAANSTWQCTNSTGGTSYFSFSSSTVTAPNGLTTTKVTGTGSAPTISNTTGTVAIATTSPNTGATALAGEIVSSTTGTVLFTMTFPTAAPHRWNCNMRDESTITDVIGSVQSTAPTTTALTIGGTTQSGDIISYVCVNH